MGIFSEIFKSKGKKRTIAASLAALAVVVGYIPVLAPYQAVIQEIAGILGGIGVTHAVLSSNEQ